MHHETTAIGGGYKVQDRWSAPAAIRGPEHNLYAGHRETEAGRFDDECIENVDRIRATARNDTNVGTGRGIERVVAREQKQDDGSE
jgi:hypothetical protein